MQIKLVKETTEEFDKTLTIGNLDIGGVRYHLTLTNTDGRLYLSFNGDKSQKSVGDHFHVDEFSINIDDKNKITFSRYQYRPCHDHNDRQSLQIHKKTQKLSWQERFPYQGEDHEFFEVDFGPETVDY
jgi:hypothetical protein